MRQDPVFIAAHRLVIGSPPSETFVSEIAASFPGRVLMPLLDTAASPNEAPNLIPVVTLAAVWIAAGAWFGSTFQFGFLQDGLTSAADDLVRTLSGWVIVPVSSSHWNLAHPTQRVIEGLCGLLLLLFIPAALQWRFRWAGRWTEIAYVSYSFLLPLSFIVTAYVARATGTSGSGIRGVNLVDSRSVADVLSYAAESIWVNRWFLGVSTVAAIALGLIRFVLLLRRSDHAGSEEA